MKSLACALLLAAIAAPASATGAMTCNTPRDKWRTTEALTTELVKQGWQVRKAKVDGGCYEVYGTTPEGDRVEAYFDPASFEKLYVSRRGEVLYKKP
ncbi:MAG: PepSY domain-containing protein [Sandaracinobacteroides sp.]